MRKLIGAIVIAVIAGVVAIAFSQTSEFRVSSMGGTADVYIDSTLSSTVMKGKRAYINGIYAFYDNAANTNPFSVEIVRGTSALRVANSQRHFKFTELMTSGGIKSFTWDTNITTDPDSAIYFVITAASSDSLFLSVNYKIIQ